MGQEVSAGQHLIHFNTEICSRRRVSLIVITDDLHWNTFLNCASVDVYPSLLSDDKSFHSTIFTIPKNKILILLVEGTTLEIIPCEFLFVAKSYFAWQLLLVGLSELTRKWTCDCKWVVM